MLTSAELIALNDSGLSVETPYMMTGVSNSQLSIARYSMGCRYQGAGYFYDPVHDSLIRADVLKWVMDRRKAEKEAAAEKAGEKQGRLF